MDVESLLDRDKTEATGLECEGQRQRGRQHSVLESVLEGALRRVDRGCHPTVG